MAPGFHDYFAIRTRHIDEYLQSCIRDGIEQLVLLGAGYDSRAYRFDQLKEHVTVFEVDHPATQRQKLEKLFDILGTLPGNVKFVPIDFNAQALGQPLSESGYDCEAKTLFIWEGVTYYISKEAVDKMLAFVRTYSGRGSSIIFDYTYPEVIVGTCERIEAVRWREFAQQFGEPLNFGIERGTIEAFLAERGFSKIHNADSEWLDNAYFAGISETRNMSPIFAIVHATIDTIEGK